MPASGGSVGTDPRNCGCVRGFIASSRSQELEVLFELIAGIGRHERSSEALHRIQALFRHFVFATKRMGKVPAIAPAFHTPPASLSSCSLGLDRKGGPRSVWYCFALISHPRRCSLPRIPFPQSTCAQSRCDGPTMTRPSRGFPPEDPLR